MTTIVPSTAVMAQDSNSDSDCVFMGEDAHWVSVKAGETYTGNGVYRKYG